MWLAQQAAPQSPSIWSLILPMLIVFVIFYFLLIRPQQKRQKQRNLMLSQLKKGDKVTTIGGLHGTIVELTDDTVVLRVNDTVKMTFDRTAINTVIEPAPGPSSSSSSSGS
ncbi:MAG: preprotein translocase subunit YajC [Thermobacillus sp. ZCTH02-B1]|uniref:preprotein translocase subunit YajC n=1 Tax=Thermobacillus sp. ZCTH02-B1 TaxID=1858795 RepID=UPI000B5502F0|nr:preprotein translocase subunit YajC [Thermobacillus sp. ZCTH02-B1]OUM96064.1 MAG: preprotein translocase subunit YajC [Thermobacillus sp. ZCTH02-B1]